MKRVLKVLGAMFGILLLAMAVFYFRASGGQLDSNVYYSIKTYSEEPRVANDTPTVMTYNLGYLSGMANNLPVDMPQELFEKNLIRAKALLQSLTPDIIGFQEIDFGSNRSFYAHQLDSLANHMGAHQAYQSVNWDKRYVPFPYWPVKYHFGEMLSGQAILSRFSLKNERTTVLQRPINAPFYYNQFYLDRLVQVVEVQVGSHTVTVMNVHLEAFDTETREAQAVVLAKMYAELAATRPVLLIGDFNSRPPWEEDADDVIQSLLNAGNIASAIDETRYKQIPKAHYTFSSDEPYQMIDYIFYNPTFIQPIDARVVTEAGDISDHLPVMMRFIFKSPSDSLFIE
jgi:endonuclease/exonuclease/phosphatase family metal-dependent hydrolase